MTTVPDDIMQRVRKLATSFAREIIDAEARGAAKERERCAGIADALLQTADQKFDQRVGRARKGERNLELAAATAAGMSHAARNILAAIREAKP